MNSNFQSRLAMTIEGITVIANNLRNQHAEQRWYTDRRLDQQDRILVEILKSTGTTEIILQASRDQDTPSDQISNDNSALVHARPSTPEAAQPLGPLRTSLKLTTSYLGNTSCPNHCSCCCHTRTVLQARSLWNAVLGYLFVGYVGSPISRRDCDSITCRRRSTPAIVVEYFFPSWFLMRAIAISFWNGATPKLSLAFPRVIAPESEIFRYIRLGQCDLLKGLFLQGRASPDDVGATTGLRPLSYAISHNQVDVCQLLISEGADPFASNNNAIAEILFASTQRRVPYEMSYKVSFQHPPISNSDHSPASTR
ncbi:hypothetical protein AOQ84DRAFT_66056 [Glonium stellatum]|uniref:Uncharacterized protein n=1 Tax=Glonium stellatum TaxID=574774 RepID=A0A8E2EYF6_9PEZI|nr:hypothetical protein AOQ84DRAFT_66056 [Glonium stellatum]